MTKTKNRHNLSAANPTLAQDWHPSKNGKLTTKDVTPTFNKKVWWQCKKGHEWATRVAHRSNGSGCPYCRGRRASGDNCLATVNPRSAKEWHPTNNGNLTPEHVTPGSNKRVWWQCKNGHEYQATVSHKTNGDGCPYCSGRKTCKDNCLATVNPQLAKEWHPAKNGVLTAEDVITGSHKKIWWLCKKGHEWEAVVKSRLRGGCPYCASRKVCRDNCLATKNPHLAKEWHPTKNGSLTPDDVMPGSNKKVWWQCRQGHEYTSVVNNKSNGIGCPCCSRRRVCKDNCLATVNPKLAHEWHPTKNGKLTPEDITPKTHKKVWWQCKKGHEYLSTVANKSRGGGCPYCNSKTSTMELRIYAELKGVFPDTRLREKVNKVECDIYIPSLKVGVEYDGVYWHRNKHEKDLSKNMALEKSGVKLIRVREMGLEKIVEDDIVYDYTKKKEKHLMNVLLKKIESLLNLPRSDQARVDQYLNEPGLANNDDFVNLLDMLPSPLPGSSLADQSLKLAKEWHSSKNGKQTPWDVTPQSNKMVWWQCHKGHEWESIVGNRSKGQGCPYCSGRRATEETSLAAKNPRLAQEWHHSNNGKVTPKDVTFKSNMKAWWRCQKGHEWEAVIASRSVGSGCPYCAGHRIAKVSLATS